MRAARGPLLHLSFATRVPSLIIAGTERASRYYSDGSHKKEGTVADMITGGMTTCAGGAVVAYGADGDSFLVKITCAGEDHFSAYTSELLSLGLSVELAHFSSYWSGQVYNYSDCIGAINTMTRVQDRDFKYSPLSHTVLGLCVRNKATIAHVKGHPERRKKKRDWNVNDFGIDLADRVADDSIASDAEVSDYLVAEILSGAIPFRLVRSDKMHSVDGSLCPRHPDADDVTIVSRRCPLFKDISTLISVERRRRYFLERQVVHSSSSACDETFLEILHMRRFDWTKSCIDIAVPMFRLRQLSLSQLTVANRIILDKHFETNVGKRTGLPH